MNYPQLYNYAKSMRHYLLDNEFMKIYISSLGENYLCNDIQSIFHRELSGNNYKVKVIKTGSFGYYKLEPIVIIEKPNEPKILYPRVNSQIAKDLINDSIINDNLRPDLALCYLGEKIFDNIPSSNDLSLFNLQKRIVLRNCGYIDPEDILFYILKCQGYKGLSIALKMGQLDVIKELEKSGLRGRGGAGFLTSEKLRICFEAKSNEKYVICNAIDSDPLSLTSRILLEGDPHSIIEGILIIAYAISASHCIICINDEYNIAINRVQKAVEQARNCGIIGDHILDSSFKCNIEVKTVPTSIIAGEETALIKYIEGKQMIPYLRPPFPAVKGIQGCPTLVNNIETIANIPVIFQNGVDWYKKYGTEKSRGTKIFTLAGDIDNKFTVEVQFGTTLEKIIKNLGFKNTSNTKINAVQFGGPTGTFIDVNSLNIKIDFDTLSAANSIMGSATINIFNDNRSVFDIIRNTMSYIQSQSCGKCLFCREGTYQIFEVLNNLNNGVGQPQDLDFIVELSEAIKSNSICGFGKTAPNPILSGIKLFREDFEMRINKYTS